MQLRARTLLIVMAALSLGGCLKFGEKTPATLFTLTAETPVAAGPAKTATETTSITVAQPLVPQTLNTLRVPVTTGPTSVAFLPDAQWADAPARLFRDLLAEVIAQRTGRPVLDLRQYSLAPGMRVSGRLLVFGYDAPSRSAVVRLEAVVVRTQNQPALTRRFETSVPAADEAPATIAASLNRAANQVAIDVSDWIAAGGA